jgi:hypothetical protein
VNTSKKKSKTESETEERRPMVATTGSVNVSVNRLISGMIPDGNIVREVKFKPGKVNAVSRDDWTKLLAKKDSTGVSIFQRYIDEEKSMKVLDKADAQLLTPLGHDALTLNTAEAAEMLYQRRTATVPKQRQEPGKAYFEQEVEPLDR